MKSTTLLLSLAMMTLWSWSGRAQENGERRRIRVIHEPSSSSSINGKQEKTPAAAGEQAAVQIQFGPSSDVRDVLRLYEMLTGQQVISTDQVKGPMPLTVTERVPKEQALALIEKALFAHGFTLINSPDLRTIQVTGPGQSPAQFPMPVFTRLEDLPAGERVAKMVFQIRHRDVQELAQRVAATYPPAPYMQGQAYMADPQSKTLVVTERTSTIREIAKLIEQLDVFDRARLIRIALVMIAALALLLLALVSFLGRRSVAHGDK